MSTLRERLEQNTLLLQHRENLIKEQDNNIFKLNTELLRLNSLYFTASSPEKIMINQKEGQLDGTDILMLRRFNNPKQDTTGSSSAVSVTTTNTNENWNNRHKDMDLFEKTNSNTDSKDTRPNKEKTPESSRYLHVVDEDVDIFSLVTGEKVENSLDTSMHKLDNNKELKYYAGIMTATCSKSKMDMVMWINNAKLLNYHINKLGSAMINSNHYTTIGFATEGERANFISNNLIVKDIGKFRILPSLDKLQRTIKTKIEFIPKNYTRDDINEILIQNEIREITKTYSTTNTNQFWSCECIVTGTRSIQELNKIWSLPTKDGHRIKISFASYKEVKFEPRKPVYSYVLDVPSITSIKDIDDKMTELNAKNWFRTHNENDDTYTLTVLFRNDYEKNQALQSLLIIDNFTLTWCNIKKRPNKTNDMEIKDKFCKICKTQQHDYYKCKYYNLNLDKSRITAERKRKHTHQQNNNNNKYSNQLFRDNQQPNYKNKFNKYKQNYSFDNEKYNNRQREYDNSNESKYKRSYDNRSGKQNRFVNNREKRYNKQNYNKRQRPYRSNTRYENRQPNNNQTYNNGYPKDRRRPTYNNNTYENKATGTNQTPLGRR
jgi:hypothetical protein